MGENRKIKNAQQQEELEEERDDLLDKCNQIFIKIRSDFNLKFPPDQYIIFNRQYANHMKKEFDLFSMCLEEVYQTFEIDGEKLMSQFLNNTLLTTKCMLFTQLRCFLNYLDQSIQLNDSKPLSNWESSEMQKMSRHKVKVLRGTTDLEVIKAQESNLINDPSDEIKKRLGIDMDPLLRENQLSKKELLDALEEKRRNLSLRESKANRYIRQSLVGIKQQIQKDKTFVADFEEKYLQTLKKTIFQDGGQQVSGILDEITTNLDKNAKQKLVKVLEFLFNSTKEVFKKSNIGVQTTLMGNAIEESEGKMAKLNRKIYDQDRSIEQLLKESTMKDTKIVSLEKELLAIKNKNAKDIDSNQQFKAEELQKQLDKVSKQLNEALEDKSYYQAQLANARKEDSNKSSFMGKNNKNTKSNAQSSNNSSQQQQSQQQESQKSSLQQKSQGQSQQQQQFIPSQGSSQSLQTQNDEQFQSQPDKNKGLTINTKSPSQAPMSQVPSSSKQPLPSSKHSNKNNSGNLPSFQDLSGAHSPIQSVSNLLSPQVASKQSAQQVTQSPSSAQPGLVTAGLAQSKQKPVFFSDKNTVGSPESNYLSQNEGYLQLKQTNSQINQQQDYLNHAENQQQVKTTQQISQQQQSNQKYSSIQQTGQIFSSSQTNLQIQDQSHHSRQNSSNLSSVLDSPVREKHTKNDQQSPVIVEEDLTNKQQQQQTIVNANQQSKQKHKGNGNNTNKQVKKSSEHNETSYISGTSNQTATHRSTNNHHHQYESSPANVIIPDQEDSSHNETTKDQANNQAISSQHQVQQHQQSKSQQLQSSIIQEQSEAQQKSSTQSNKSQQNAHSQQQQSQSKQSERNTSQIRQSQQQQKCQQQNNKSQQQQEGNSSSSHNGSAQYVVENQSPINNAANLIRVESNKQSISQEKNIISSSRLSELVQSQHDLNLNESSMNNNPPQTEQQYVNIRINQSEEQPEDLSNLSYSRTRNSLVDSEQNKGQSYFQQQHVEDSHENYINRDSSNVNVKETQQRYQQRESLFNHDSSSVLQSTVINSVPNIAQISNNVNNNQISANNLGSIGVLTSSDNLGGLSQNVLLSPQHYLQGNADGNNLGNLEGQRSNFGNTLGGFQRGSDGDISSTSNNNTKYSARVDVKEFLDLFDLENDESEQPSQSTQILEVLRNKRNPKRREVINAIVEVINKKKTNQSKESQNKQQIRSESIRQEEGEEEDEEEGNLDQQGQTNRKNLRLTEKKKKKAQNSSGFTSSDQGQVQNKKSAATATSLSSTAVLAGIQENTNNDIKNQDVFSGDSLNKIDKGFFKDTPQSSHRADVTNRSNMSNSNGQAQYFEDERGKYEKQSATNKNNKSNNNNNNGSANNLDRYLQYQSKGLSETDRGRRNNNNTSPQSDQLVSEAKLKKQYLTQVTFKDANKAQKQSQKQLPQDNQLANFEEDPDVLARLVQKQEVIQDVQRKKNQIAMSRFQAQNDLSSSSTFYEKSRGSQVTVNGSSSLTNIDGKQPRSQAQTMWKQKDEFRIIDPRSSMNLFNGGQISSASKLDSIDPSRKNTNPSRTQGTIYKKPPPFNEDEHFVKDLYEHMKIGQIDLSQLKELDMQGGSVPRIQQRDEQQPPQQNMKVLNNGRVVDTNNIKYDEFADYYSDVLQQHRRCGPFCYHLKRFYEKLNFNVKAYQNRQAIQCPTLVVQELQRENKKQPAKFNLKNPSTHI